MDQMVVVLRRSSHDDLHRQGPGRHESRRRSCHARRWHAAGESEAGSRRCLRVPRRYRAHEARLRGIDARSFQLDPIGSRSRTGKRGGGRKDYSWGNALCRPRFSQWCAVRRKGPKKSRCYVHSVWREGSTIQGIWSLGTMLNFIYNHCCVNVNPTMSRQNTFTWNHHGWQITDGL